jgi:hypothetical protein
LDIEDGNRIRDFGEPLAEIFFVPREDLRLIAVTERQSPVTVEFDLIDPISGPNGVNQLRLHRFDKVPLSKRSYPSTPESGSHLR